MRILVLGLGNDFYGDDGVGLEAVRMLEREWAEAAFAKGTNWAVEFEACPLTGLALLDVVAGFDALVVIDTVRRPDPATGRIRVLGAEDLRDVPGPSPHYVSIPQTLAIGRGLGLRMPERIKIIAVEAKNLYRLGEGLTAEMRGALPEIVAAARGILENWPAVLRDTCP
ncbi:MAG: hydrogenase maturation protease [Candidatus Aminicenantes bacterium]|nr:hydrogenase maturation protease [Candidatus Aminicenantes bacterium]